MATSIESFWDHDRDSKSTFRGVKIVDLSRAELLGVVSYLMRDAENTRKRTAHERTVLALIRGRR